jgi:choline dehydrogenase-like flavoprotein
MTAAETYDAVIVGAGVAGALVAKRLSKAGMRVLLLEAGPGSTHRFDDYADHVEQFYGAAAKKGPESAWTPAVGAPQPDTGDIRANNGYFVQRGPHLYGSSYTRVLGGSTLHWLGVSLRMLPEDFEMRSRHGVARDWPIGYETLRPYYEQAEHEMGVSADRSEQDYFGLTSSDGYDYPMKRIPPSYSDRFLSSAVDGMGFKMDEEDFKLRIRTYPAARNSMPRNGYRPVGAVDVQDDGTVSDTYLGERCEGNTSCTPICPVQAKYNAGKSLAQADRTKLTILPQAVASKILIDSASGAVQGIEYDRYEDARSAQRHQAGGQGQSLHPRRARDRECEADAGLVHWRRSRRPDADGPSDDLCLGAGAQEYRRLPRAAVLLGTRGAARWEIPGETCGLPLRRRQ